MVRNIVVCIAFLVTGQACAMLTSTSAVMRHVASGNDSKLRNATHCYVDQNQQFMYFCDANDVILGAYMDQGAAWGWTHGQWTPGDQPQGTKFVLQNGSFVLPGASNASFSNVFNTIGAGLNAPAAWICKKVAGIVKNTVGKGYIFDAFKSHYAAYGLSVALCGAIVAGGSMAYSTYIDVDKSAALSGEVEVADDNIVLDYNTDNGALEGVSGNQQIDSVEQVA